MIAGIILSALGLKKVLEYVADTSHYDLSDPLELLPLSAMYGGVALYLLALVAFRYRLMHSVNLQRIVGAVVLIALVPAAAMIPALAALGVVAGALACLITFEAVRFSEIRERVRHEEDVVASHLGRAETDEAAR